MHVAIHPVLRYAEQKMYHVLSTDCLNTGMWGFVSTKDIKFAQTVY
jgi:hypothetical protein